MGELQFSFNSKRISAMLTGIHIYTWLSNRFMGRGLKKRTDRGEGQNSVDFNIDGNQFFFHKFTANKQQISPLIYRQSEKASICF